MCGITGFIDPNSQYSPQEIVRGMTRQLTHRGPDDSGVWVDPQVGVALGHCRLSILDLSQAGHQPMVSADDRYWLSYNGELYNHLDLRDELTCLGAAPEWRGHSDTETLLAVLAHWGIPSGLRRLNGMFSLAMWDRAEKVLFLARDRIGEKPLYYGQVGGALAFASELSSLRVHPDWQGKIDTAALALFLRFGYIPAPWSIYTGVFKLPPAHYLAVRGDGRLIGQPTPYWSLADFVLNPGEAADYRPGETVSALHDLLADSVERRMQADVPVGCFLSGGIDSSTVAALMQQKSPQPIKTFTIGFREETFNEAEHAKAVARHLGTDHTELYLEPRDAISVVPRLPEIWDEPFADSSQIPTFLVSKLAREQVKVVLSGDGGDELFHGYGRYELASRLWTIRAIIPRGARPAIGRLLSVIWPERLDELMAGLSTSSELRPLGPRLAELGALISEPSRSDFYERLVSGWSRPEDVVLQEVRDSRLVRQIDVSSLSGLRSMMMWIDTHMYLPDDILAKLDRASMAVGLEARVPLLDHRVVELAWQTPMGHRHRRTTPKWALRQILEQYVPGDLVDRPKMGFGVPIEKWLRGPLRDWAEDLLEEKRLGAEGYFDPQVIRREWTMHLSRTRRNHYRLWNVLMFQAWLAGQSQSGV